MRSRWLNYSKTINEVATNYVSAQSNSNSNSNSGGSPSVESPNVTAGPGIFISDEGVVSAGSLITEKDEADILFPESQRPFRSSGPLLLPTANFRGTEFYRRDVPG